mgnify:CR=1 FL=1
MVVFSDLGKMLGMRDVEESAHPEFDRDFIIRATTRASCGSCSLTPRSAR